MTYRETAPENALGPPKLDAALERFGGSVEILRQQVLFLLEDVPGYLAGLEENVADGSRRDSERAAHSLKGAMLTIDAVDAVALAEQLEAACQADDATYAALLLPALRIEVQRTLAALGQWLKCQPAGES